MNIRQKKGYTLRYFAFGVGISILMALWSYGDPSGIYDQLELRTLDQRFVIRGDIPQDPNIGTIDIDDETYQIDGRMEDWTRNKHAELLNVLSEYGARMIGFDIFFPEPSRSVISREDVEVREDYTAEEFLGLFRNYDQELAQAAQRAGNVYFSETFERSSNQDWDYIANNTMQRNSLKEEGLKALVERGFYIDLPQARESRIPRTIDFLPPLALFTRAVKGVGHVNPLYDVDGVARWFPLLQVYDQKVFPALVLMMACDYLQVPLQSLDIKPGSYIRFPQARFPDGSIRDLHIPIDDSGAMLVNWAGQYEDTFVHYPYTKLIRLKATYQDNVVLRDVKRLIQKKPELLTDMDAFIMEAIGYNIQPAEAAVTAYFTVGLFGMFESAVKSDPNLDGKTFLAEQGFPEEDIPALVEKFNEIRNNVRMAELLEENPNLTLSEMAALLDVLTLGQIEHGYHALKNIVEHGGIKPEHHPLIFFTEFHDGKELLPSDLKDKVLVYGLTATGTQDYAPIPIAGRYKMVGYQANALNTILTENFLSRLDTSYSILIILGFGVIMGVLVPLFGPVTGAGVVSALLLAHVTSAYFLFKYNGLWIDIVGPVGVVVLSYLSVSVNNYIIERRERAYIQDSFKMYLSPAVVDQIADNPDLLSLGGKRTVLTILFTDVAGFSTISEKMTAEGLVELLNEYLGTMTDIIMNHNGTVDKYEGDLIMAFWGAPIDNPNHAVDACFASLAMNHKLGELRTLWRSHNRPPFISNMDARIGMNTGEVVVGNMGSKARMDYTVMGDHVNLASRLEGANKPYGTHLMISHFTHEMVKEHVEVRELDKIRVVGRDEPVTVYELLSKKGELDPERAKLIGTYNEGLRFYKDRQWDKAFEKFIEALSMKEKDGPSKTYIDRCERYKAEPPPPDWDGVESLKEK